MHKMKKAFRYISSENPNLHFGIVQILEDHGLRLDVDKELSGELHQAKESPIDKNMRFKVYKGLDIGPSCLPSYVTGFQIQTL